MAMSCGQGLVVGWHAAGPRKDAQPSAGFAAQLELRPPRGQKHREIPVCGEGIGDMQRRGAGGP
jgi:hypothetical protein